MKKVTLIALALVLCLGAIGIGYAKWFDELTISGIVETGTLDAELSAHGSMDSEPAEKDVSYIHCWVDEFNPKLLHVEVVNAYPSINYWQEFDIYNSGTIPFIVDNVTYNRGNLPADTDLRILGTGAVGDQIHPGEAYWYDLWVHLNNDAGEGNTYWFTIEIFCTQWNEAFM
jgi:hypothetical protein